MRRRRKGTKDDGAGRTDRRRGRQSGGKGLLDWVRGVWGPLEGPNTLPGPLDFWLDGPLSRLLLC
jgi:hypothetical protein